MTTARRNKIGFFLAPAIALMLAGGLSGQSNRATITGRVMDVTTSSLQGAQVQVQPIGLTAVTDAQGEFRVPNLPPGNYKLVVKYVGFKTSETEVSVEASEVKRADIHMDVATQAESIIVTAERPR